MTLTTKVEEYATEKSHFYDTSNQAEAGVTKIVRSNYFLRALCLTNARTEIRYFYVTSSKLNPQIINWFCYIEVGPRRCKIIAYITIAMQPKRFAVHEINLFNINMY